MKLRFTEEADRDYAGMPVIIRKAFAKQLRFLLDNRSHPSLHAKKYSEAPGVLIESSVTAQTPASANGVSGEMKRLLRRSGGMGGWGGRGDSRQGLRVTPVLRDEIDTGGLNRLEVSCVAGDKRYIKANGRRRRSSNREVLDSVPGAWPLP